MKKGKENNVFRRALSVLMAVMLCISSYTFQPMQVQAAQLPEYEIYPIPHEVTYQEDSFIIRSQVNVVYDEGIDEATKDHIETILEEKGKTVVVSEQKRSDMTNVLVGIYDSDDYVDTYVQETYAPDASLFEKIDAYYEVVDNDEIVILGKDTDAAFYGITSLKHIFAQMDGSTIRCLEMEDYADTQTRGFIEGYYGIPWSDEDRISLMEFGGEFKMTSYIFAPKDDPYHKGAQWRALYPQERLDEIKKMVDAGNAAKCRFVFTIHPFGGSTGVQAGTYEQDLQDLKDKFDQLYSIGVRQFGVLGDDVGNLDRSVVIQLMNDLQKWADEKGDVYDLVFCPAGYNHSWQGNYSELNEYDGGFDERIQIFWTGEAVCQPVEVKTLDHFRRYNLPEGTEERRAPLFWLNWPVNDINAQRLMMGKGSLLHTDVDPQDLKGVVTNPMQEAEASKVALFAVADYAWNVKAFDDDQSWADSFKYIDSDASEELHTLAKHMSNPQPNNHGLVLAESEELQPIVDAFKQAWESQDAAAIAAQGEVLKAELQEIADAADGFMARSQNEALKEELEPFAYALRDTALADLNYVDAAMGLSASDDQQAMDSYSQAIQYMSSRLSYRRTTIDSSTSVTPGSTCLIPFGEWMEEEIGATISNIAMGEEAPLKITASSSYDSFYGGTSIENIIDGNEDTYAWYGGNDAVGQYYQLNLSKPTTVYGIHVINGTSAKPDDTYGKAKLQYQQEGSKEWLDVNDEEYGKYATRADVTDIMLENVVAVRYICTEAGGNWPSMREFSLDLEPQSSDPTFTMEVIYTQEWTNGVPSGVANLIDGNEDTSYHFPVRNHFASGTEYRDQMKAGDYYGVKLSEPITLGEIRIVQGVNHDSDYMKNATLEYSLDNSSWTPLATFTDQKVITFDASDLNVEAQYIRLRQNTDQANWCLVNEISVSAKVDYNGKAYTNLDREIGANYMSDHAYLETTDVTLNTNQYIGFKLNRIHELESITLPQSSDQLTLQVSKNALEWTTVNDGNVSGLPARYVRLINTGTQPVTISTADLQVTTNEIEEISISDAKGFTVADPSGAFDGDRTTSTQYEGYQTLGNYFTYDLGQTISLEKLRVVCMDSEWDYPRHMKISASADGSDWSEVMTIGDQTGDNPGEATNEDHITDVLPEYEASCNTKSAELETPINVRYLKFEITRSKSGSNKWVRFQEIEINDGAYLPKENNPTYSGSKESENSQYRFMNDGNLSTMFAPETTNDSVRYALSEDLDDNLIKVIQNGSALSQASVRARVMKDGNEEWLDLGVLSQTISEFKIPEGYQLLDVKIAWEDKAPQIMELVISHTDTAVDKNALQTLVDELRDTDITAWTTGSRTRFANALQAAENMLKGHPSQSALDSARTTLQAAYDDHKLAGDSSALQKVVDNALTDSENYTASTWKAYSAALNAATAALAEADDHTQEELDALQKQVEDAQAALVYNPSRMEEATLQLEGENDFIASVEDPSGLYTDASWNAYTKAASDLQSLIDGYAETPVHPDVIVEASEAVTQAKAALVSVASLQEAITEYENTDASLYDKDSFAAYEAAVESAKKLLENGTEEQIAQALSDIREARSALRPNSDALGSLIREAKALDSSDYTRASYDALMQLVDEIETKGISSLDREELAAYTEAMGQQMNALVSVRELNRAIALAEDLNKDLYTSASYQKLQDEITAAKALREDASAERIDEQIAALNRAMSSLEMRVDNIAASDYIDSIELAEKEGYTSESYDAYKKAYDALVSLKDRLPDVSITEFNAAKNAFETAQAQLQKLADKSKLQDLIDRVADLSGRDYTAETFVIYQQKLILAQRVLDDPDASQKEADVAYDELNAAVNALVRRETPGGDVSQPADTSAANTVGVAVAAVVVCAAVLGVLLWKKRSNKDEK